MRLCSRCNQWGETADPCTCTDDLIEADQEIAELKEINVRLQYQNDRLAAMVEVDEILHNRQAKIEALKTAERNAVRECERIASRHIANAQHVAYKIRNRYPQHFGGE